MPLETVDGVRRADEVGERLPRRPSCVVPSSASPSVRQSSTASTSCSGTAMSVSGTRQSLIAPITSASAADDPVLVVVRHVRVEGQRQLGARGELGDRQRDVGKALAVGGEPVDRGVEDARLDAALAQCCRSPPPGARPARA